MTTDGDVLRIDAIRLGLDAVDADDAVVQCGRILTQVGAVDEPYVAAMLDRERAVSTVIGHRVAVPHAVGPARRHVRRTTLALARFPGGVDWRGEPVSMCAAIACREGEPVELISLVVRLLDERRCEALRAATDRDEVFALLRDGWAELTRPAGSELIPVSSFEPTARRSASSWAWLAYPTVPGPTAQDGRGQASYSPVNTAEASSTLDR
jgi:mannitol/fructose-specific phosphotransferase system IIA component